MTQPIEPRFELLMWDWRESPDIMELSRIVSRLSCGKVFITEANTGSDQMAILISTVPITAETATEMFNSDDERWSDLAT
jgi:hypothetical protein